MESTRGTIGKISRRGGVNDAGRMNRGGGCYRDVSQCSGDVAAKPTDTQEYPPKLTPSQLVREIEAIPEGIRGLDLADRLETILDQVASIDHIRAEVCLKAIDDRFDLGQEGKRAYRAAVKERRRQLESQNRARNDDDRNVPVPTASLPSLVDLVLSDGEPKFLLKIDGSLEIEDEVEQDGQAFVPPKREQIPWLLPRAEKVLDHYKNDIDGRLFDELVTYHRGISELPSEAHYVLLAAWDFHTYFFESAQYSPILWLYAVPERGKTRTGKGIIFVAHRGLHVESLREAYLLRVARDLKATLFIDVMDLWKKAERQGSEDILLMRFERGARVPRVMYPDKGPHRDTVYYDVFGPTILGTNEPINEILETRSVSITLPQAHREFRWDVTAEKGLPYRERLVAWRARVLGADPPEVEKPAAGRLGDMLRPLMQIIRMIRPERERDLRNLVEEIGRTRLKAKAESFEARVLASIAALGNQVSEGLLPLGEVTGRLNRERGSGSQVTPQKVGRCVRALGFEVTRTVKNTAAIHWDEERLERVMAAYGLPRSPGSPETPDPLPDNELATGDGSMRSPATPECAGEDGGEVRFETVSKTTGSTGPGLSGHSGDPGGNGGGNGNAASQTEKDWDEADDERAGILEYEGGLSRQAAEAAVREGKTIGR